MKIYFGQLDAEMAESFRNDGDSIVFEADGLDFEFCLEVNQDGFTISDGISRMVPFCHSDIKALRKALKAAEGTIKILAKADAVREQLDEEIELYIDETC